MFYNFFEFLLFACMFYINISVLPRARYKMVWKRYLQEEENGYYIPRYEYKDFGLALMFPFFFITGQTLNSYMLMMDEKILNHQSFNCTKKAVCIVPKVLSTIFSSAGFVCTTILVCFWWALRWLAVSCMPISVIRNLSINSESSDITVEQIKQQLADTEAAKGLSAMAPVLAPARGDWQNQVYPHEPEKVSVEELIN